jgi:hypothetical protein
MSCIRHSYRGRQAITALHTATARNTGESVECKHLGIVVLTNLLILQFCASMVRLLSELNIKC